MNYLTSWRLPRASARKAAVETTGQPPNCKKSQRFHQPARNHDYDQDSGRNSEHEGFLAHPPRWAMTLTAARASLGNQVLPLAVKMPATCVDINEWLAVKTFDVFNEVLMVWSFVKDQCLCKDFTAGDHSLPGIGVEPGKSAKEQVRVMCVRLKAILQDPLVFVIDPGFPFPANFQQHVSYILTQLMQVYCHVYREHFEFLVETDTVAYVNCCFKHALLFGNEFRLITEADIAPIANLARIFLAQAQREQHQAALNLNPTSPSCSSSSSSPSSSSPGNQTPSTMSTATALLDAAASPSEGTKGGLEERTATEATFFSSSSSSSSGVNAGARKGGPSVLTNTPPTYAFQNSLHQNETNSYQHSQVSRSLPRHSHMMPRGGETSSDNTSSHPYNNQCVSPPHQHPSSLSPSPSSLHMKTDQMM